MKDIALGAISGWMPKILGQCFLAMHYQEKTSFEQEAKAGLLVGGLVSGLLHHLLHVVMVMMVVVVMMAMVVTMMMVMTMMLCHRGCIRARHADSRHGESDCDCKAEGREEGLLHGSFPFFAGICKSGRSPDRRA